MDVIRGALAVAGSILIFVKIHGSRSPIKLPATTVSIMVQETTKIISGALKLATTATPIAIVTPNSSETNSSFF